MASSLISVSVNSLIGDSTAFSVVNDRLNFKTWLALKIKSVEIDSQAANTNNPIADQGAAETYTANQLTEGDIKTLKVIQPTRLRITAFANSISAVESVINTFTDLKATVTITTKGIKAAGMCVTSIDLSQEPGSMSATKITIEMEQVEMPVLPSSFSAAQSADSSTVYAYGVSIVPAPISRLTGEVSGLYNKVSNFLRG